MPKYAFDVEVHAWNGKPIEVEGLGRATLGYLISAALMEDGSCPKDSKIILERQNLADLLVSTKPFVDLSEDSLEMIKDVVSRVLIPSYAGAVLKELERQEKGARDGSNKDSD